MGNKQSILDVVSEVESYTESADDELVLVGGTRSNGSKVTGSRTSNKDLVKEPHMNEKAKPKVEKGHSFFWSIINILCWCATLIVIVATIMSGFGLGEFKYGAFCNAGLGLVSLTAYQKTRRMSAETCAFINVICVLVVIILAIMEFGWFDGLTVEL